MQIDTLVARAQRDDPAALDAVCERIRPLLVRHGQRLLGRSAELEDAVQEALLLVCARIGTYRWEGSFAGWVYAVATRSMLRHAAATPREAEFAVELAEQALVDDHDPLTEAEWALVEQDLHLECTIGVLVGLSPDARRLYLLGEVLAVPDRVGAEATQTSRAAYRKRLERARRAVADAVRAQPSVEIERERLTLAAEELDDLVRLGELHRARARGGTAEGALRALARIAPTLAA
jgi:RNA polymerase sigma factor (sigma-70 family)